MKTYDPNNAPEVELVRIADRKIELAKRQYVPYILSWVCPDCKAARTRNMSGVISSDGGDFYLSFSETGRSQRRISLLRRL